MAYVYGFLSVDRQREVAKGLEEPADPAQLARRADALRLLMTYLGALDQSLYSARAFVAEALSCYRWGRALPARVEKRGKGWGTVGSWTSSEGRDEKVGEVGSGKRGSCKAFCARGTE